MNKNAVSAIPLTSVASTALGTYAAINPNGLPHPCFILKITNNADADVTISYDGTTDNEFVPKQTALLLNVQAGAQPRAFVSLFAQGLKVYVKGTAGMSGSIYLSGYYLPTGV